MISRLFALFSCLICLSVNAQLSVDNSATPEDLVNEVLLGEGIEVSSISFNNGPADAVKRQFGSFQGGLPHIGIESGIILATGGVEVAEGPNDIPTAHVVVPASEQLNEDPDLQILTGGSALRDVAIIEFDFTAKGDTVRFRYVFASEEYNDHTCSPYNDAFGFFVSGPGITGSPNFANQAKNFALVPGKNVPVAINTVNTGSAGIYGANAVCNAASSSWQENQIYFVNNAGNPDPGTTQFDGFTVPMTIEIPVICGETYHIKIAVADAVDDKNDSAVFIEAESFSGEVLLDASLTASHPEGLPDSLPDTALEGCSTYRLEMYRSDTTREKTIFLRASGLDNPSAILEDLPASVVFEAGVADKTVEFSVADDGDHQGLRNWTLELLHPNACGQDTAVFALDGAIDDREPLAAQIPDSLHVPCHDSIALDFTPQGGIEPYTVTWESQAFSGFEIEIVSDSGFVLNGSITDFCGANLIEVAVPVIAENFDELVVALPETAAFDCAEPLHITPEVAGGSGDYGFLWKMDGSVLSEAEVFAESLDRPGLLELEVSDRCAETKGAVVEALWDAPPVSVFAGDDVEGSCIEEVVLIPEVTGGFGDYTYLWKENHNEVSAEAVYTFFPERTARYTLTVTDRCGQKTIDTLYLFLTDPELEVRLPADTTVCIGERLELKPEVTGGVGALKFLWIETGGTLPAYISVPRQDRTLTVRVTDACQRTREAGVHLKVSKVEAAFSFDFDFPENPVRNLSTSDCTYLWTFPDGSQTENFAPVYIPERGRTDPVILTVTDVHGCEATAIEFYEPPMSLFIPTAFTPDGDGLNDVFKAKGHHVADFHLWIFDKGGNLVFESTDLDTGWTGEGASGSGATAGDHIFPYRYVARTWSGEVREGHGSVVLLR